MKAIITAIFISLIVSGCGTSPIKQPDYQTYQIQSSLTDQEKTEIVLFSLNLLDTKYNWGGKKPNFGLDCSGLVSYVFNNTTKLKLRGAAKDIVKNGTSLPLSYVKHKKLEPGNLLFFNTTGKSYSHVGIYIGNDQFLHASSGRGKVIVTKVTQSYYLKRLEEIKRL